MFNALVEIRIGLQSSITAFCSDTWPSCANIQYKTWDYRQADCEGIHTYVVKAETLNSKDCIFYSTAPYGETAHSLPDL